jgi:hypothetical protein
VIASNDMETNYTTIDVTVGVTSVVIACLVVVVVKALYLPRASQSGTIRPPNAPSIFTNDVFGYRLTWAV